MQEFEDLTAYRITVTGCDDSTIVHMLLNKHDFEVVSDLVESVNTMADQHCQPTMEIK